MKAPTFNPTAFSRAPSWGDLRSTDAPKLGSLVVPFCPFPFWVPLSKPDSGKKGTLTIKGLLGNLVQEDS